MPIPCCLDSTVRLIVLGDVGRFFKTGGPGVLTDDQQFALGFRGDGGAARGTNKQRHFTKEITWPKLLNSTGASPGFAAETLTLPD